MVSSRKQKSVGLSKPAAYYALTKPGIIYGNLCTTIGAFYLASAHYLRIPLLLATCLGMSLVIGGSCALNNVLDRDLDTKMTRTKRRPIQLGLISVSAATRFGIGLVLLGELILLIRAGLLTAVVAAVGTVIYVFVYSPLKPRTHLATVIGSVAGAIPPLVGYVAVRHHIGIEGGLVFLILALWQLPHFYAIACYRKNEYQAAGVPVLPLKFSKATVQRIILGLVLLYVIASCSLWYCSQVGNGYLIIMSISGIAWLYWIVRTWSEDIWAKQVFLTSLVVILIQSVSFGLATRIP